MSDGWVQTTLGEAAEILMGQSPPGHTYNSNGEGLPFLQGSAEFGEHTPTPVKWCSAPAKIAEVGDLMVSVRAPVGDTNYADQKTAIGRGLAIVRARGDDMTEFLRLVIQHKTAELLAASGSGMFSSITAANLRGFQVSIPPLAVQRRIVDLMAHLDTHITNLRAERDGLDNALTIACLEFTAERQGVHLSPISDVAEILDRLRVPISEKVRAGRPGNVPYFGANGQVGWIDEAIFDEPLVLLAEDGGPVAEWRTRPQAYTVDGPCWVNNHAHVLRATVVPRDWLYFSLRHRDLTALAPVGTRSKLTQASLKEIQISLPDDLEEKSERLRSMEDSVSALEGEIAACRSLRSTVLRSVLSRELAIPNGYDSLLSEVS